MCKMVCTDQKNVDAIEDVYFKGCDKQSIDLMLLDTYTYISYLEPQKRVSKLNSICYKIRV